MKKLLYFGAEWCSACKKLQPIVAQEAPQKGYEVEFLDMDEDDGAFFADEYYVRGLPTIIILEDGKEVKRAVGNTAWKEVQE